MKLNFAKTCLALAGAVALLTQSAYSYTAGDLYLGLWSNDSSTYTKDLVIDLGSYSTYSSATGTIYLGNYSSVLNSTFGNDAWLTNSTLYSNIIGLSSSSNLYSPVYASAATSDTYADVSKSSLKTYVTSSKNTLNYAVDGTATTVDGTTAYTQTVDGTSWGEKIDGGVFNGNAGSFSQQDSEGTFTYYVNTYTGAGTSTDTTQLTGYFTLDSAGNVYYNVVPEPSTYALMILGCFVLYWSFKRRSAATV
jgi:hypothetical protein